MREIPTVASSVAPPSTPQQPGGSHVVAATRKDRDIGTGKPERGLGMAVAARRRKTADM